MNCLFVCKSVTKELAKTQLNRADSAKCEGKCLNLIGLLNSHESKAIEAAKDFWDFDLQKKNKSDRRNEQSFKYRT
jgi:hypothetical protein